MEVACFTFNPFQENTYVLFDETKECAIVDPGCYDERERGYLRDFIAEKELTPKLLLNTHCHIDHILGNAFVAETWNLGITCHEKALFTLGMGQKTAQLYQLNYDESPKPKHFVEEGDTVTFGNTTLDIRFVPGHSVGHIVFIHHESKVIVNGDVLFQGSIGRTDLPGGNFETLEKSIKEKMYTLPDDYVVLTGHGPETTIGHEKRSNPFIKV